MRKLIIFSSSRFNVLVGGILGLLWFYYLFGPSALNPSHISWLLMQGDWAQHVLGWLFFRHEPWTFPLGSVRSFGYPIGTTVGFTDAIPWVAMVAKSLSPLLPVNFQYIGPWLGLSFFLQGALGLRIVQELSPSLFIRLLGGAFFILDPVLARRVGHDSLCAHWLILGLIWLHVRPCPDRMAQRRLLQITVGLCLVSAGIHPYLAAMVLALSLALLCKLRWGNHLLSTRELLGWGVACCASVVAVFVLFGYLGTRASLGTEGFGYYSADLLTLINPMGSSRVLPTWPTGPGQYEGFGYVGGGVLVLCVIGIVISWHKPGVIHGCWIQEWVPLAACCVLLTAFAFSSTVTIAGIPILELGTLYRPVIEIVMPFRTSGRFIWPLHYFVITGVLAILIRQQKSSQFTLIVILVTTVIIQLLDIRVYPFRQYLKEAQREEENLLNIDGWQYIGGQYEHIVLYPPHLWSTTSCTIQEYILNYYVPLAYQAYKLNLTFNSGYFARIDGEKVQRYCNDLGRQVREGEIQADTIYVVHISHWNVFKKNTTKIACGRTREYIVCISAQRYDAFREFLTSHEFPADP